LVPAGDPAGRIDVNCPPMYSTPPTSTMALTRPLAWYVASIVDANDVSAAAGSCIETSAPPVAHSRIRARFIDSSPRPPRRDCGEARSVRQSA
jgi:hypothetical protein